MDPIAIGQGLAMFGALVAAVALLQGDARRLRLMMLVVAASGAAAAVMLVGRLSPAEARDLALAAVGVATLGALLGLARIVWSESAWSIRARNRPLRRAFGPVSPAAFRAFVRLGARRRVDSAQRLTREGWPPEHLWYIESGRVKVEREGRVSELDGPFFVGEICLLTGAAAAATVTVLPGAEMIEWEGKVLRDAFRRRPALRPAVEAVLARDLARKISAARPAPEIESVAREENLRLAV